MLTVATLIWQPNRKSRDFSRCYSPEWVDKLYRGFKRGLTLPFNFVCYSDFNYNYNEPITKVVNPALGQGGYGDCIRPYELNEPMILVGLDTIITGNCDALAHYCLTADKPAYPIDPYRRDVICNGVGLIPRGWSNIAIKHRGENDMDHVRSFPHNTIDALFPGQVQSYKGTVKRNGIKDTRICYFHGQQKPHQLDANNEVLKHWV